MSDDPLWYKDAIIYQMHVKAFQDANGDGIGDFAGLAQKLDYIQELGINHTSDQHPWFQAARLAPPGSREREFYVWSDDDKKLAGTRIIFTDTESSNWAWDPLAGQYYWHRFFSHQPDLNHNNPKV